MSTEWPPQPTSPMPSWAAAPRDGVNWQVVDYDTDRVLWEHVPSNEQFVQTGEGHYYPPADRVAMPRPIPAVETPAPPRSPWWKALLVTATTSGAIVGVLEIVRHFVR